MPAPAPTGALYLYCDSTNNQLGFIQLSGDTRELIVSGYVPTPGTHNFFAVYGGDNNYPGVVTSPNFPYEIDADDPQVTFNITFSLPSPQPQGTAIDITVGVVGSE